MNKTAQNKTLKQPAQKTVAKTGAGLKGYDDPRVAVVTEVASKSTGLLVWGIKLLVIGGIGYWAYGKFTNRFISLKTNTNYPPSNVSDSQAKTRADAIAASEVTFDFGSEFATVSANLAGLNYNGFIKVYNAFGKHSGTWFSGDMNLIEWLQDQFNEEHLSQLRNLLGGAFFKTIGNNNEEQIALTNLLQYKTDGFNTTK